MYQSDYAMLDPELDNMLPLYDDKAAIGTRHVLLTHLLVPFLQSRSLHEQALALLQDTQAEAQAQRDIDVLIRHSMFLAQVFRRLGKVDSAHEHLLDVIKSSQDHCRHHDLALAHEALASILLDKGDNDGALGSYEKAFSAARQDGFSYFTSRYLVAIGEVKESIQRQEGRTPPVMEMPEEISPALMKWITGAMLFGRGDARAARQVLLDSYQQAEASQKKR